MLFRTNFRRCYALLWFVTSSLAHPMVMRRACPHSQGFTPPDFPDYGYGYVWGLSLWAKGRRAEAQSTFSHSQLRIYWPQHVFYGLVRIIFSVCILCRNFVLVYPVRKLFGEEAKCLWTPYTHLFFRGETNRSNIRIKVFVHRCSNFVSLFEFFVPLAHELNNSRSEKIASFSDGRVIC